MPKKSFPLGHVAYQRKSQHVFEMMHSIVNKNQIFPLRLDVCVMFDQVSICRSPSSLGFRFDHPEDGHIPQLPGLCLNSHKK